MEIVFVNKFGSKLGFIKINQIKKELSQTLAQKFFFLIKFSSNKIYLIYEKSNSIEITISLIIPKTMLCLDEPKCSQRFFGVSFMKTSWQCRHSVESEKRENFLSRCVCAVLLMMLCIFDDDDDDFCWTDTVQRLTAEMRKGKFLFCVFCWTKTDIAC